MHEESHFMPTGVLHAVRPLQTWRALGIVQWDCIHSLTARSETVEAHCGLGLKGTVAPV